MYLVDCDLCVQGVSVLSFPAVITCVFVLVCLVYMQARAHRIFADRDVIIRRIDRRPTARVSHEAEATGLLFYGLLNRHCFRNYNKLF